MRGGRCRAIVRRKGHQTLTHTFPTKTAAKVWADRMEREMAAFEAGGGTPGEDVTIAQLIDWRIDELARVKEVGKTQSGNLTRLREGLGDIEARRLTANDVIAHARRRCQGDHMMPNGKVTRACARLAIIDLHFHDLRHEATSRLFEAGYDIPEVASVTLHSSWNELKRYTQLRPESLHRLPAEAPASGGSTT